MRCERWHSGNVVLLGDAAHTAHYSIGSGTKLAMEDAIALVGCLRQAARLEQALQAYESERRPAVEHLQEVARPQPALVGLLPAAACTCRSISSWSRT